MLHKKSGLGIVALATTVIAGVLFAPVSAITLPSSNHGGGTAPSTTARLLATALPSQVPQIAPGETWQWTGLSSVNDGTGELQNTTRSSNSSLHWAHQTFGVDLDWSNQSLWRVEAQTGTQLVKGQAVALRVWGGGWLRYGHQTFGVDLDLSGASGSPSYEWRVLGGQPGSPLSAGSFALWNDVAQDYLVASGQTFGVDLNWYKKTLPPPPPPPPPPPTGVKHINILNCVGSPNFDPDPPRTISVWARDATAGAAFTRQGNAPTGWGGFGGSSCTGQSFTFTPSTAGHVYQVLAVDYNGSGCTAGDAPNMGCNVLDPFTFTADPTRGVDLPITIG